MVSFSLYLLLYLVYGLVRDKRSVCWNGHSLFHLFHPNVTNLQILSLRVLKANILVFGLSKICFFSQVLVLHMRTMHIIFCCYGFLSLILFSSFDFFLLCLHGCFIVEMVWSANESIGDCWFLWYSISIQFI